MRRKRPLIFRDSTGREAGPPQGEIIGVKRGLYEHYGIYCGKEKVIHYTLPPVRRFIGRKLRILCTDLDQFLRRSTELFVLDCQDPRNPQKSEPIPINLDRAVAWFYEDDIYKDFHLYSPEETVRRAKSQIGKGKYNLLEYNCEHFAVWCKTGLAKSYQVENVLRHFRRFFYRVERA